MRCQWSDPCPRMAESAVRIGLAPHHHDRALCAHHRAYVYQLGFGRELSGWQAKRVLDGLPVGGAMGLTA